MSATTGFLAAPRFELPRAVLSLGARLGLQRVQRRLGSAASAVPAQHATFRRLRPGFAATVYGKSHGIARGTSYADFAARVPLASYETLSPFIERMKRGEAGVLWPGRCAHYAVSSGTTAGRTKYLPFTPELRTHFNRAGLDALFYYCHRVGHTQIFRGRHLFLGGSTALTPLPASPPFTPYAGDLSALTALGMPGLVDRHLYEPGSAIAQMGDWTAKIEAIVARTASRDITLVAGIPSWLLILAERMRQHAHALGRPASASLQESVWPHLECLVHGGVPVGPFRDELLQAFGRSVRLHEVYPASEGFIAAQDAAPEAGLRLMADAGLFFEFLPLREFDEGRLAELGPRAVPLEGVTPGEDYALVLTTPGGLCRYVIGDVVRFVTTAPPRLLYVGRTRLQLSAFGEHVIEKELTDALIAACRHHGGHLVNFHVAPLFPGPSEGRARGRHEWWLEFKPGAEPAVPAERFAVRLDAELMARNDDYEAKRRSGGLDLPLVRLLRPGVFEYWQRHHGRWGGQSKLPRCRSDREIADELGRIAPPPRSREFA